MGLIFVDCCNIKMSRILALLYIFVFFVHKTIMIVLQPGDPISLFEKIYFTEESAISFSANDMLNLDMELGTSKSKESEKKKGRFSFI